MVVSLWNNNPIGYLYGITMVTKKESEIYNLLIDYGMDANWFSMYQSGQLTDETGEKLRLEAVWGKTGYENDSPNLFKLLMRLTKMLAGA